MSTALAVIDEAKIQRLDDAVNACTEAYKLEGRFQRAFTIAAGVAHLRECLDDEMMTPVHKLQGTRLGFLTDKVYTKEQLKAPVLEACLRGANFVGNEFNIIKNNLYLTKEFYVRVLSEMEGLGGLSVVPGAIRTDFENFQAHISMKVTWKYKGSRTLNQTIEFAVNAKIDSKGNPPGPDYIRGKGERKIRAWLHQHLTGMRWEDGEIDAAPAADNAPASAQIIEAKAEPVNEAPAQEEEIDVDKVFALLVAEIGEDKVIKHMISTKWLQDGQTLDDVAHGYKVSATTHPDRFIQAVQMSNA